MDNDNYYYTVDGRTVGPVLFKDIRQMVEAGALRPDVFEAGAGTAVFKDGPASNFFFCSALATGAGGGGAFSSDAGVADETASAAALSAAALAACSWASTSAAATAAA